MDKRIINLIGEINVGLYEKAKEKVFSLLKKDPYDPLILNTLVLLYLKYGNVKIADRIIQKLKKYAEKDLDIRKNIITLEKIKYPPSYNYTFLFYAKNKKDLIDFWRYRIKKGFLPSNSHYFFLIINPSPITISFCKKNKIPLIGGKDLVELINKGLIEKKGRNIVFSPISFTEKYLSKLISPSQDFKIVENKETKDVIAFSIGSHLLYEIGLLESRFSYRKSIRKYVERIREKNIDVKIYQEEKEGIEKEPDAKISLCMIVKDEEKNLGRCLESVRDLVDEIIVVDTGSNDRTPQIAEAFGAKIFYFKWQNDFSLARNESIKHARHPWIFWLDADDYIEEKDKKDFLNFKETLTRTDYMAFRMPTLSFRRGLFEKRDVNNLTSIFRNHPEIRFEGKIHEQILYSINRLKGKVGTINIPIYHTGYENPELLKEKKERNKRILEEALKDEPENPIILTYLGRTYMEEWIAGKGSIEKAEKFLKRAIALFPPSETNYLSYAYLNLSIIYYHKKVFEKAINMAKMAIKINKDIESAYEIWGRSLLYLGRFKEAEKVFLDVEKRVDRESPAYIKISDFDHKYYLATTQFNMGKYEEAIENFKNVSIRQQEKENIDFLIGMSYYKLKDFRKAIEYFRKSIQRDSSHYDSWNNLGNAYLQLDKLKKAEDAYREALRIREGEEVLFSLGHIYYIQDRYKEAKEYFKKLEKIGTKEDLLNRSFFYLADIYFSEGDIEHALKEIERITNVEGLGKEYYILMGKIFETLNQKEEAARIYAEGLIVYEYDLELMGALAEVLEGQNKLQEAISIWEEILKRKNINDVELMRKLGLSYARLGFFKEAISYFEEILKIEPHDVRIYNDLGVFYGMIGELEKAEKFFREVLTRDPSNKIATSNLKKIIFEKNKKNLY